MSITSVIAMSALGGPSTPFQHLTPRVLFMMTQTSSKKCWGSVATPDNTAVPGVLTLFPHLNRKPSTAAYTTLLPADTPRATTAKGTRLAEADGVADDDGVCEGVFVGVGVGVFVGVGVTVCDGVADGEDDDDGVMLEVGDDVAVGGVDGNTMYVSGTELVWSVEP